MPRSHSRTMSNLRLQRRHYQFIADVLSNQRDKSEALVLAFAHALRGTNANYSHSRFVAACGETLPPTPKCLLCQSEAKP